MSNLVKNITIQRVRLDAILTDVRDLPKSRGAALGATSLEKGRMYLGELCGQLSKKDSPYEATKSATTAEGIQDAADKAGNIVSLIKGDNEVVNLNVIREALNQEIVKLEATVDNISVQHKTTIDLFKLNSICGEAWRGLKETRMWLGVRMGEIRDNSKK